MKAQNKNNGFKIPENYLEDFNDSLLDKITSLKDESILPNKEGFSVPEGYFKTLHQNITDKLEEKEIKVIPLKSYKKYYYSALAVAAVILLFIGINLNKTESYSMNNVAHTDIDAYIEYTDLDLSTYEIAEAISMDNLDIADMFDSDLNEDNIMEYLEDNVDNFHELNLEDYEY